jgi:uncharacterized membrane protein YraQ (UPF0718 family)
LRPVSNKTIKSLLKKKIPRQTLFPLAVLGLYLVLWCVAPEKTVMAVQKSMGIFSHILGPLLLVFLFMIGLNLFLKPANIARFLGKEKILKMEMLAVVAGIISAGPIYAWYPILKDLREKGVKHSLLAVFLVNRAIKPFLLPVMISIFGWLYAVILTMFIIAGSLLVGFITGVFLDAPTALLRLRDE